MPQALAIGVDYELFWKLTPKSLQPFVSAFNYKRELNDYAAWVQGMYIKEAIVSAMVKNAKYPSKPFSAQARDNTPDAIKAKMMRKMDELNARRGINNGK